MELAVQAAVRAGLGGASTPLAAHGTEANVVNDVMCEDALGDEPRRPIRKISPVSPATTQHSGKSDSDLSAVIILSHGDMESGGVKKNKRSILYVPACVCIGRRAGSSALCSPIGELGGGGGGAISQHKTPSLCTRSMSPLGLRADLDPCRNGDGEGERGGGRRPWPPDNMGSGGFHLCVCAAA
jgi:hypothetical protein